MISIDRLNFRSSVSIDWIPQAGYICLCTNQDVNYNLRRIHKSRAAGEWFTNSSSVLPTSQVVYQPINHKNLWSIAFIPGPGYPIDGNWWSEIQSSNRYQSIKLVNWHRLVSANQWPINNHTKTVHWLLSIGSATSKRHHARYLSDHPPFLGSPGDAIWPSLLNAKNITCCTCTQITHLPIIAFPCHNVYVRRMGRGFTEYKVHRQRLSSLPFWGERWWSVNCKQEEGRTRKRI